MALLKVVMLSAALASACFATALEEGLVLHYTFDEGEGVAVYDRSGQGNDGQVKGDAEWVKEESYTALRFNGTDTSVECPPSPSLGVSKAATLEVWARPDTIQGGMIAFYAGDELADRRLTLQIMQHWYYGHGLTGYISNGNVYWSGMREPWRFSHMPKVGEWGHFVLTLDGTMMHLYQNGRHAAQTPQPFLPNIKDIPLRIGVVRGAGGTALDGLISEVRVYNRPLSRTEVAARYLASASAMGHEEVLRLKPRLYASQAELLVEADLIDLGPLPEGAQLELELRDSKKKLQQVGLQHVDGAQVVEVKFETDALKAGTYSLHAIITGSDGASLGQSAEVAWELPAEAQWLGRSDGSKILNNLVTELVNLDSILPHTPHQQISFVNPRDGWIFVSATALLNRLGRPVEPRGDTVAISIDADREKPDMFFRFGDPTTQEIMRFLKAGPHTLHIRFPEEPELESLDVRNLVVRAVPELIYCNHPCVSRVGYAVYDEAFLRKDILPNINAIVGAGGLAYSDVQEKWRQRGGKWYEELNIPSLSRSWMKDVPKPLTAEYTVDFWTQSLGFTNPNLDGVFADEFIWCEDNPDYPAYIEAIKKIAQDKRFSGKAVQCWFGGDAYACSLGRELMQTVIDAGYQVGWEAYYPEMATEELADEFLNDEIARRMELMEQTVPGLTKNMVMVLGIMSVPIHTIDMNPHVDFKVWLDLQFNYLANSPQTLGLAGIMNYKSRYADEEVVRWCGRLFRHYGIEGKTDMLSDEYGFKYELDHMDNADFDEGVTGWTVSEAESGSVSAGTMSKLGMILGRYNAMTAGNSYLLTRRSDQRPNKIKQVIKNLEPGKLYSIKLYTADYQDLRAAVSMRKSLAVSINLDNVNELPAKRLYLELQ